MQLCSVCRLFTCSLTIINLHEEFRQVPVLIIEPSWPRLRSAQEGLLRGGGGGGHVGHLVLGLGNIVLVLLQQLPPHPPYIVHLLSVRSDQYYFLFSTT